MKYIKIISIYFFLIILIPKSIFSRDKHYITTVFSADIKIIDLSPNNTQRENYLTGGFSLDVGHLYIHTDDVVHSMDTRVGFSLDFDNKYLEYVPSSGDQKKIFLEFDSFSFYTETTYSVGQKLYKDLILVDILGINLGYFKGGINAYSATSEKIFSFGNSFSASINLPLGVKYIFDSGILLGFRHRMDFVIPITETINMDAIISEGLVGSPLKHIFSYTMNFSFGFVFGK